MTAEDIIGEDDKDPNRVGYYAELDFWCGPPNVPPQGSSSS